MITIRRSRFEDGERVLKIWCDAVDATHDFLSPGDRAEIEVMVRDVLPPAPLWLATDVDDYPLGFMLLEEEHMEALFVDPAHRGQGIGRMLVEHALGLHPALTTDVNEQNGQAIGFYERLGFVRTGRSATDNQGRPYPLIHLSRGRVRP